MNRRNRRHMARAAVRRARREAWVSKSGRKVPWTEMSYKHLHNIINWCDRTRRGLPTFSSPQPTKAEQDFATLVQPIAMREYERRGRWTPEEHSAWLARGADAKDQIERALWLSLRRAARYSGGENWVYENQ